MSGKGKGKKKGIVVDMNDPRKAMIEANWGGANPDKRKRKKREGDHPLVDALKKLFG